MMGSQIARAEDIIWRRVEDETVVITDDGLSVHVLNKTATYIWELCDGSCGPDEITASLCERFDVSSEEANADVKDIIAKLEQMGLLKRAAEVTDQ
jgi:hypothetical protein